MRGCAYLVGKEAYDLDKDMVIEKLIRNAPFDYTKLLEIAESQPKPFIGYVYSANAFKGCKGTLPH